MVYKIFKFKDGRTATLDWLEEDDLPELVDALNGVIREDKFLLVNTVITGMEEEREWFERSTKAGMHYLAARVDGKVVGGASIHPFTGKRSHVAEFGIFIRDGYRNMGLGTELTKTLSKLPAKAGSKSFSFPSTQQMNERFMFTRNAVSKNVANLRMMLNLQMELTLTEY